MKRHSPRGRAERTGDRGTKSRSQIASEAHAADQGRSGIAREGVVIARFTRASNATRVRVCTAAIAASLTAIAVRAAVDFVWYVPACMAIVALLAAGALRTRHGDPGGASDQTQVQESREIISHLQFT